MWRRLLDRVRGALRRHRERWLVPVFFVALVGWTYRTVWVPPDGKPPQWLGWDGIESYWPDLAYYAGALEHGEAPLWNPYDRGGYAFYADTVTGLYYPVTWAFVVPGAALGAMPGWTQQVKMLLHHVLSGLLLYVFLRRRKLPWPAALVGGTVVVLSIPLFIHKASAVFWNLVWAPLIWIAIDAAVARAREPGWWWRAAGLAGAIALAGAAGPPPGFFYALLASLAYGGLRLGQAVRDARRAGRLRGEALAQARVLGVAAAAAVLLLAIIVVPGLDVAAESATRGATRTLAYALGGGLPPGPTLIGMVAPPAGHYDAYLGLLVLVLAAAAVAARPSADRYAPVLFAAVAMVALILAFGADGQLLPWLARHVPGFGLFREANRYKLVAAIGFAVVAAYGAAALVADDPAVRRRARRAVVAAAATLAAAIAIIAATTDVIVREDFPGHALSLAVLGVGTATLVATTIVPTRRRAAALVCAAIAVHYVDLTRFGAGWLGVREAAVDDQEDRRYLAQLGDVERGWRIYDEFVMEQRPGSRLRVRDLRGYPSGDPFDDARYAEVRARLARDPELLAAYNVRWVLWGPHHRNGTTKNHLRAAPDVIAPARFRRLDARRWVVNDPAPLIAWYGAVTVVPDRRRALDEVAAQEKAVGTRRRAVVEAADRPRELAALEAIGLAPPPVPGRLVAYGANEVAVEIDAPAAGVVVLNEKLLPGWRVTVDGAPAAAFRANYMLRAVTVPAGRHQIVWSYHPPRFRALFVAWLAGLAFLGVAAVAAARAARRRAGTPC